MGFLSVWGRVIIVCSIIGCLIGLIEAEILMNGYIAVFSVLTLVGGIYTGYLGIAVDELQKRSFGERHTDFWSRLTEGREESTTTS